MARACRAIGEIQDRKLATKAPRLKKADGELKFNREARQLVNQVRAFQPWPGSFTTWTPEGKNPVRLIVLTCSVASVPTDSDGENSDPVVVADVEPGQVAVCDKNRLWIKTGDGLLSIDRLQPAGKKPMPIADFLRGNQPGVGDRLGT